MLGNASGQVAALGVTPEHPLFAEGAGELLPGDQIRGADLGLITVLSITLDDVPQRVYTLEVEGAHTFFAGELDVWAHNGFGAYVLRFTGGTYVGKGCPNRMRRSIIEQIARGAGTLISSYHDSSPTSDRESFQREHELMCENGWDPNTRTGLLNRINSPGWRS